MKKGLLFLLLGLSIGFASCKKEGCTNELAINYDKEAEKDDGTIMDGDNICAKITSEEGKL